jgi:flagellar basal body P-ring formation protein FlgA
LNDVHGTGIAFNAANDFTRSQMTKHLNRAMGLCLALLPTIAGAALQRLDDITATAHDYLTARDAGGTYEIEITLGRLDPRLRLAACAVPLTAAQAPGARRLGHSSVNVRCEGLWSIFVPVTIREKRLVAVATAALPAGHPLTETDFRLEPTWVLDLSGGYIDNANLAVGQVTTRPLQAGVPLLAQGLRRPRAVKRGATITLALAHGPLAIRVGGVALQDGAVGDRIQVRNSSSQRIVEAEIHPDGTAVVR